MANSSQTTISKPTLGERWETIKPAAYALAIGLIAGPILSNMFGFQILSSTARDRSQSAGIAVQAEICAAQAMIADPKAGELDWSARRELAEHWAIMPGTKEAAPGVAVACGNLLAG